MPQDSVSVDTGYSAAVMATSRWILELTNVLHPEGKMTTTLAFVHSDTLTTANSIFMGMYVCSQPIELLILEEKQKHSVTVFCAPFTFYILYHSELAVMLIP